MSLSTSDLSFMDLFLEKEDPLIHFDKDIIKRDEIKTVSLDDKHISDGDWQPDTDTFFNSILGLDEADKYPFTLLSDTETEFLTDGIFNSSASSTVESSSCSDSGLSSSEQQLSPILHDREEVEEDPGSTESEGSDDAAAMPVIKEEVVELDESVYDIEDTGDMHFDTLTYVYEPMDQPVVFERPATVSVHTLPATPINLTQSPPHKVIRLPNPPSSRSLLIPINVKGTNGTVHTIRVMKPSMVQCKGATIVRQRAQPRRGSGSSGSGAESSGADDSATAHFAYPRLQLTLEEKRLMAKEGVTLPSHYPLTKMEERELKRIRRKIRNKISAQDSRKRKKEYVDSLEDRVKQCAEENLSLVKRVRTLQGANSQLSAQLRRLQQSLGTGGARGNNANTATAQPSTCLMVLVLSLALVMAPNMRHTVRSATNTDLGTSELSNDNSAAPFAGRSRTLLFSKPSEGVILESPLEKLDDLLEKAGDGGDESDDSGLISDMLTFWKGAPLVHVKDHDYTGVWEGRGRKRERSFIVPPIDEEWQPAKRSLMERLESKMAAAGAVSARARNKTKMAGTKAVVINLASDGEEF